MFTRKRPNFLILALTILFFISLAVSSMASKGYEMVGKISAIDLDYKTVVIDVPLSNGQIFKVGGPLSPGAVLKKGDMAAGLSQFHVGDKVWVKWRSTEKGHVIDMIEAK